MILGKRLGGSAVLSVLLVSALLAGAAASVATLGPAVAAGGPTTLLHDDFTRDTALNTTIWQINGPVGTAMGPEDVGFNIVQLAPTFSSAGMKVEQVNHSQEVGTIQSVDSFNPPFTLTAVVEGIVSNGHTFGLAVTNVNTSSGVLVYGNLNATNCSHLADCGDPSVCGSSANPSIPSGQCYYGIDAKVGRAVGSWPHVNKLFLTPSIAVYYTLQISVDAQGNAQFGVSQGGQVLGASSAQVGSGPFYVILEQGEGSPVAKPGPNQAIWMTASVAAGATTITTTSSSTTGTSTTPGVPGIYVDILILAAIGLVLLLLLFLLAFRRRKLKVHVVESTAAAPVPTASVTATGPEDLSDTTDRRGEVVFTGLKKGEYMVRAVAEGYLPRDPVRVDVKGTTKLTVRLDRVSVEPPAAAAPSGAPPAQAAPPASPEEPVDVEGWGGPRLRQIAKTFQDKGAVSPETAMTADELGLSRLFVRLLKRRKGRAKIFIEVNGKYYLDQKALQESKED